MNNAEPGKTFSLVNIKYIPSSLLKRVFDTVKLPWNCLFVRCFPICSGASLVHQQQSCASISGSQFNTLDLVFFITFSTEGLSQKKYLQSVFDYDLIQTQFGKSFLHSWGGIPNGPLPSGWQRETPGVIPSKTSTLQSTSDCLFVCEA